MARAFVGSPKAWAAISAVAAALHERGEAVVEHARDAGGRCAVTELILLRGLAAGLSGRAFAAAA